MSWRSTVATIVFDCEPMRKREPAGIVPPLPLSSRDGPVRAETAGCSLSGAC